MTHSDNISEALFQLLINASDEDSKALFDAVEGFKVGAFRTYADVKRKGGLAAKLIDAMEEAKRYGEVA